MRRLPPPLRGSVDTHRSLRPIGRRLAGDTWRLRATARLGHAPAKGRRQYRSKADAEHADINPGSPKAATEHDL